MFDFARAERLNRTYSIRLGWSHNEVVQESFPELVCHKIRDFQKDEGLDADGIMGIETYSRWLDRMFEKLTVGRSSPFDLAVAGLIAVNRAKRAWLDDIVDPQNPTSYAVSRKRIDDFIRVGLGWTWQAPYLKDGDYQWCGAFVSWCYMHAGLSKNVRLFFLSSTYRLDCLGRGQAFQGHEPPKAGDGNSRLYVKMDENSGPHGKEDDDVRPGDVLLVGGTKRAYGDHITLVESYSNGVFTTLEGNATGMGPAATKREGVIRTTRPLGLQDGDHPSKYHARRLIRFSEADFK